MSQGTKSQLYKELKAAGVEFARHYREYTTEELSAAVAKLRQNPNYTPPEAEGPSPLEQLKMAYNAELAAAQAEQTEKSAPAKERGQVNPPVQSQPFDEHAGQRAYDVGEGETPIRTDEQGRIWYREEVAKAAFPKPRARRRLTYIDSGVETRQVVNGQFLESFEIAGNEQRTGEVRITLPSFQVGVYKDPKFPFKVHVYNGNRGFDLFDIQKYYGGADLVPSEIKRTYVGNDLCYDVLTTIRTIQTEYRQTILHQKG